MVIALYFTFLSVCFPTGRLPYSYCVISQPPSPNITLLMIARCYVKFGPIKGRHKTHRYSYTHSRWWITFLIPKRKLQCHNHHLNRWTSHKASVVEKEVKPVKKHPFVRFAILKAEKDFSSKIPPSKAPKTSLPDFTSYNFYFYLQRISCPFILICTNTHARSKIAFQSDLYCNKCKLVPFHTETFLL